MIDITTKKDSSKKAIIIGASSGIGKALAKVLSKNGYILGLVARREELLKELQNELSNKSLIKKIDITQPDATNLLFDLIKEMNGVDLIIINAGTGFSTSSKDWNKEIFDWSKEKITIDTNVIGFTAMVMASYHYFLKQKKGHLVGISSVAALIPNSGSPAYSASKAFVSNYLQGLSIHAYKSKLPIAITDIRPGFVDTKMAQGEGIFWKASKEKASMQIYQAIKKKKTIAYITKRWNLVAGILKILPKILHKKLF